MTKGRSCQADAERQTDKLTNDYSTSLCHGISSVPISKNGRTFSLARGNGLLQRIAFGDCSQQRGAGLYHALMSFAINRDQPGLRAIAKYPLKVIEQRPMNVSANVDPVMEAALTGIWPRVESVPFRHGCVRRGGPRRESNPHLRSSAVLPLHHRPSLLTF